MTAAGALRPEAILFDFGGTLDADGVPWKERFFRAYRDEGVAVAAKAFDPVFYAADDALVGAVPQTLSFDDTVGRLARGITAALRPGDDALAARVAARFLDDAHAHLARNRALLARLATRYRLGIVSNFYGNLAEVCDNTAVRPFLGVVVDSTCVGYSKPDPRMFRRAADALGVAPAAAVFVGDSLTRDMAGARGVGMPHVWLVEAPGAAGAPCCAGDRVVGSLEHIEELLR
jgi:putative hydrolase of the HAD superfamily